VGTGLAATTNGNLGQAGQERADLITTIRPRFEYSRRNPQLQLDVAASAGLLFYANGTQPNALLPDLRALIKAPLVERLLYLDAGAEIGQAEADPFGARVYQDQAANRQTRSLFRMSPYLLRDLTANSFVLARYDAGAELQGGTGDQLISTRSLLRYEARPVPLGGSVEVSTLDSRTRSSAESRLTVDAFRATARAAFASQMVLEVVAGSDRSHFANQRNSDPLYGVGLQWNPGPRTALAASAEHRFYGPGVALRFQHRTPFMAFRLTFERGPVAVSSTLGDADAGSNLRPYLDSILTTRHPDPTVRSGLVDSLIGSRALNIRVPQPISTVAGYAQLESSARATWVLLGVRNTGSVTIYAQTRRQLTHDNEPAPDASARSDTRQVGASFQFSRRLTPQVSAVALVEWSRIAGLAARSGELTEELAQRFTLRRSLSPRTSVSAGVQHQVFDSNADGQHPFKATSVFTGLNHTF
jgi:uncharacterized protein (PEP-CTERM system associated)